MSDEVGEEFGPGQVFEVVGEAGGTVGEKGGGADVGGSDRSVEGLVSGVGESAGDVEAPSGVFGRR